VDLFAEGARSWIEKAKQVLSGYKILDGRMVLIDRREIPSYHDSKKHNFSRLRRNMSSQSELKTQMSVSHSAGAYSQSQESGRTWRSRSP
jgi:hypothetical protein